MRIKPSSKPVESERDKLLREGRLEARKEIERRFHARTKQMRGPGNGVSEPHFNQDTRSNG